MSDRVTDPFRRPETSAERLRSWWGYLPVSRAEFHEHMASLWHFVTDEATSNINALTEMRDQMAADREMLTKLAADMSALAVPITDILTANAAMRARITELEGTAAADELDDTAAVQTVRDEFDKIAGKFTAEPTVPDVEPLPEPEPAPEDPIV